MVSKTDDTKEFPILGAPVKAPHETISSRVRVDLGGLSDRGRVRGNNEDHFLISRCDRVLQHLDGNLPAGLIPQRSTETAYGMIVADGMGGMVAGELASRTAITELVNLVLQTPDWLLRPDELLLQEIQRRMAERFDRIRQTLVALAREDPTLYGMGTTMTLACSHGRELVVAHVGDSRAYLFRHGQLHRLTRDHTIAQEMVNRGLLRPEEADTHPRRHMLTTALASAGAVGPTETHQLTLMDGDQVLLCSDGLTEMVADADVADLLRLPGTSTEVCRALVDRALEAGGKDNVTVVLARYNIPAA
jgi:protein phosphatase